MDQEFDQRLTKLEKVLDAHLPNLYAFIDELREYNRTHEARMVAWKRESDARLSRLEDQDRRLIDVQADTAKILRGMNGKLTDHEDRLSSAGS